MALWSYSCGHKGLSAVRVYERSVSASLYIEWYVRGRRYSRSLKSFTGAAVTDKRLAMRIAHELARQLERDSNRYADQTVFGRTSDKTLGELLKAYHMAKGSDWTEHHRKAMERFRKFWLDVFGPDCPLHMVTDGPVEQAARGLEVSAETRRKYLVYLTGAYRFARRKMRWISDEQMLTAVELPKGGATPDAYTLAEVRKLLPALEAIGEGPGWFGHTLFQSGRRPITVRHLLKADMDVQGDYTVVRIREENDKVGKAGSVVLVGRAHELTAKLMQTPGKYMLGEAPPEETWMLRGWLRKAEKDAGVPKVRGRGWYGFKRRYAAQDGAIDMQSGVRMETLRERYRPDDLEPKRAVALKLSASLSASKPGEDGE